MTSVEKMARGEGEKYFGLNWVSEQPTGCLREYLLLSGLVCEASLDPLGLNTE